MLDLDKPNPALTDEEVRLLSRPEECLRHAVSRGALSLDRIVVGLPAHIATAVRGIVTGERPPAPPPTSPDELTQTTPSLTSRSGSDWLWPQIEKQKQSKWTSEEAHYWLGRFYPSLDSLLTDELLTTDEAMSAAHKVDAALGRYTTGTRYAAP